MLREISDQSILAIRYDRINEDFGRSNLERIRFILLPGGLTLRLYG
jgi:hypothetical protein